MKSRLSPKLIPPLIALVPVIAWFCFEPARHAASLRSMARANQGYRREMAAQLNTYLTRVAASHAAEVACLDAEIAALGAEIAKARESAQH